MTRKQMIAVVELFSNLPRSALHQLATFPAGLDEDRLLEIQDLHRLARDQGFRRSDAVPAMVQAIGHAARETYACEDIQIDEVEFPYDVAEGEDGTWVLAWVRVDNDAIQTALQESLLRTDHARYDRNPGGG